MQRTSRAYKTEQKQYLRNEQYIFVYLGVISREAQANATSNGEFMDYSSENMIFENIPFEAYYETAEQNLARCDGSQYFMPRDNEAYALYQGAVTADILGSITFTFGNYHSLNIKGLTIDFGDFYPTSFTVTNGYADYTYTYDKDNAEVWTTEDVFMQTDFIKITPHSMVGGVQRLRILSIKFGVGLTFDNYNLISTSWKAEVSHLSDSLPTKSFTFTVDNLKRKFSADNPRSFAAFLQEQQEVVFDYGRRLADDSIYIIPGGKLNLSSWSSNDEQAKFTAVGFLDYITTTYNKGQYYPDGITLYDLAVDVCEDAGIENYSIDSYLKRLRTHNPLPVETHKNLLQLLANSAQAILRETRDGSIEIKTSFKPELIDITSNGHTDYSNLNGLLSDSTTISEYASAELDFNYTDGHQYFMPRNTALGYVYGGYISEAISNAQGEFEGVTDNFIRFVGDTTITGIEFTGDIDTRTGTFLADGLSVAFNAEVTDNPTLTLTWEATWTFFNMTLEFSDVYPSLVIIHLYKDGNETESLVVDDIDLVTLIQYDFYDIDQLVFEFVKTNPYQRIHLGKIYFGDITDYTIEYSDMSASPTATRMTLIKNVNVVWTEFNYGTDVKSISTVQAIDGVNTTDFRTAYHDYSLEYKEIKDDEEEYTKASKVFCDTLPSAESAKTSTRYFVRTQSGYDMYVVETNDGIKEWEFKAAVTETIVNSLPITLDLNVLYLVRTDTDLIYHIYMLYNNGEEDEIISLGYDVRGTLTILDSGAYYIRFTSNVATPVTVSGIAFLVAESTYVNQLHELGEDKTATNVLIDSKEWAERESIWLGDYFNNDVDYKVSYRGEPALDPDDQIYLENRFVEKNLIRVTSTQIDTSTGMSMTCAINGRRISYESLDVARVDYAIVDESEVS